MFHRYNNQTHIARSPQWDIANGKVLLSSYSSEIFRGDEILDVTVVDASRMDVPSITLGKQRIPLQPGQQFPIRFQLYYDRSRAGIGVNSLNVQARITNRNGQLLYINDTSTPLKNNVKIHVRRV